MDDIAALALRERACDATDRIPTARFPLFGTTIDSTVAAGGTQLIAEFEAERDVLFTDLSIILRAIADEAVLLGQFDLEYCNTIYADHDGVVQWPYCCSRKGVFLVGVRENKKLRFVITLAAVAPAGGARSEVTLTGFQGNGCCP